MTVCNRNDAFSYQLLGRLQQDCEYYLGFGNRAKKHLWAGDEASQIAEMRKLFDGLAEKPEWLSLADIARYEAKLLRVANLRDVASMASDDFFDKVSELLNGADKALDAYGVAKAMSIAPMVAGRILTQMEAEGLLSSADEAGTLNDLARRYTVAIS